MEQPRQWHHLQTITVESNNGLVYFKISLLDQITVLPMMDSLYGALVKPVIVFYDFSTDDA